MQNTIFGRRGLPCMLAAVMVLALPGTYSAWAVADSNAASLLNSKLPPPVTMHSASNDLAATAVRAAVKEHPEWAANIVRVAILAKTPKHGEDRDFKDAPVDFKNTVGAPCAYVVAVTRAAIAAAPDKASDVTQTAVSLDPDCADALNNLAATDSNDPSVYGTPEDFYGGFGVGFGPGFPGSPGFSGSAPSGAIALPPAGAVVVQTATTGG